MKPVNLYPNALPSGEPSGPNIGLIGGVAAGVVLAVVVAGFFGFARVDSIKSETSKLQSDAASAQSETQTVQQQIEAVGTPVVDGDKAVADNAVKTLISVYKNRVDFRLMATELQQVMAGTGGWYTKVDASADGSLSSDSSGSGSGSTVNIEGIMPTAELAAGFDERIDSTQSFTGAKMYSIKTVRLQKRHSSKVGTYYAFSISATLVDTLAPYKDGNGPAGTDQLVAGGGAKDPTLSLDPAPVIQKATRPSAAQAAATAAAAAAKNPLALAASAALGGGS